MADIVRSLKKKRGEIDEILTAQTRREGEMKALLDGLERDFGVTSVEEAEQKLGELDKELDRNEDSMHRLDEEMAEILAAAKGEAGSEQ